MTHLLPFVAYLVPLSLQHQLPPQLLDPEDPWRDAVVAAWACSGTILMHRGNLHPAGIQGIVRRGHRGQHRTVSVLGSPCLDYNRDFALVVARRSRLGSRSKDCHSRGYRNDWACLVGGHTGADPAVVPEGRPPMPAARLGLLMLPRDWSQSLLQALQVWADRVVDIVVEIQNQGHSRRGWKMRQVHFL